MDVEPINNVELALSRLPRQYFSAVKYKAEIEAVISSGDDLQNVFFQITDQLVIDKAKGVNLNVLGIILGISRIVNTSIQFSFFGFTTTPNGLSFGEENNPSIGGKFYNEGDIFQITNILPDEAYRLVLKSKILKNKSKGTVEDIISALKILFPLIIQIEIIDNGDASIDINLFGPLTEIESKLILDFDLIPKPAGVKINDIIIDDYIVHITDSQNDELADSQDNNIVDSDSE